MKIEIYNNIKNINCFCLQVLFVVLIATNLFGQTEYYNESEVKAVYLKKFTQFVEWPSEVNYDDKNKPFIIGFIGSEDISKYFKEKFASQKIKGKTVKVQNISALEEINQCNMLFISQTEKKRINHIISFTKNKPVLTVSDDAQLSKNGVLIILFNRDNHIYFEIDNNAVERSGLYVSTLLLSLSKVIDTEEN